MVMSRNSGTLQGLLAQLRAQAELPLQQARALPADFYWREDVWQLEQERIFRRDWICIGRSESVAAPGDWLKVDLVGEPLLVVHGDDGQIRALSRVCRHRSMDMLHDVAARSGQAALLTCPYHLWSYRLDGRLRAAPWLERALDDPACRLPSFPLLQWQGFLFVNLDAQADLEAFRQRLRRFEALLGGVDMGRWRRAGTVPWGDSPVNWKVAFENFSEFLHHIGTHQQTLQPLWPAQRVTIDANGDDVCFAGRMVVNPALATGVEDGHPIQPIHLPPIAGLTPAQRGATLVLGLFPLFAIALGPEGAYWFHWLPTGPTSHCLDIELLVPPESFETEHFDAIVAEMLAELEAVQAEDAAANLAIQAGVRASAAEPGPLAELEAPLWQFQRYLARQLA